PDPPRRRARLPIPAPDDAAPALGEHRRRRLRRRHRRLRPPPRHVDRPTHAPGLPPPAQAGLGPQPGGVGRRPPRGRSLWSTGARDEADRAVGPGREGGTDPLAEGDPALLAVADPYAPAPRGMRKPRWHPETFTCAFRGHVTPAATVADVGPEDAEFLGYDNDG